MKYIRSEKYNNALIKSKIMGPNPIKLEEELLLDCKIPSGARVMDLGSGEGITSVFLVQEYGYEVYAADLWSDPDAVRDFFNEMGLTDKQIHPVHADATSLPFENNYFDGVISTDSYNYFGRDSSYLDKCLLPCVKPGGYIYITVPGMKKDCHDNFPPCLLLSWNAEQLDYIHDAVYWKDIMSHSHDAEIIEISEMESNEEVWADWVACDNDYARGDKKSVDAGACEYLNFIKIVLRKK